MSFEIPSLSERISESSLVPSTFLRVVAARSLVEWLNVVFVKMNNHLEICFTWNHQHCRGPGLRHTHWSWPQHPQWRWRSLETKSWNHYWECWFYCSVWPLEAAHQRKLSSCPQGRSCQCRASRRKGLDPEEEKVSCHNTIVCLIPSSFLSSGDQVWILLLFHIPGQPRQNIFLDEDLKDYKVANLGYGIFLSL